MTGIFGILDLSDMQAYRNIPPTRQQRKFPRFISTDYGYKCVSERSKLVHGNASKVQMDRGSYHLIKKKKKELGSTSYLLSLVKKKIVLLNGSRTAKPS
jgi:hypothetical protein